MSLVSESRYLLHTHREQDMEYWSAGTKAVIQSCETNFERSART